MFTPFDPALLTHRAARHVPADAHTREANRQRRAARRAAWRAVLAEMARRASRLGAARLPLRPRA